MKNIKAFILLSLVAAGTMLSSCKKDKTAALTDLAYNVAVEGYVVTFTTKTEGVTNQKWDFGDGETSTDANPVHTYPGKGKYVATLTATVSGKTVESSAVLRLSKTSPVKINDNSLADWDAVTKDVVTLGARKGIFRNVKLDYDGNYIYVYIETTSKRANGDIYDFYIDSDNSTATGLLTGTFNGGGYDILMEGAVLSDWFDVFYHTGATQNAFTFTPQSISDAYTLGTVQETDGSLKFELRIDRSKLKGLTGKGLRIGIQATKSDWSVGLGSAPDDGGDSYFLDMNG